MDGPQRWLLTNRFLYLDTFKTSLMVSFKNKEEKHQDYVCAKLYFSTWLRKGISMGLRSVLSTLYLAFISRMLVTGRWRSLRLYYIAWPAEVLDDGHHLRFCFSPQKSQPPLFHMKILKTFWSFDPSIFRKPKLKCHTFLATSMSWRIPL